MGCPELLPDDFDLSFFVLPFCLEAASIIDIKQKKKGEFESDVVFSVLVFFLKDSAVTRCFL